MLTDEALLSVVPGYLCSYLHLQYDITQPFVLTVRSSSRSKHVRMSDEASAILSKVLRGFPQSFYKNYEILT